METKPALLNQPVREAILLSAATHADNSLWNYVSILSWLRTIRAAKVTMLIFPAVFGGLASWYSINVSQSASLVAALAALAGFFPVVYVALGIDQSIGYYRTLAGKYRLINARFHNISTTSARYTDESLVREYDDVFAEYCRVREEAHTVPRWCFGRAKKVIERGEYALLGNGAGIRHSETAMRESVEGTSPKSVPP